MKSIIAFAQKGVILNRSTGKFVAIRYGSSKYLPKKLNGKLALPGGQLDFGEDLDDSFVREIKEETGLTIKASLPFYCYSWTYQKEKTLKQIVAIARIGYYLKGKLIKTIKEKETTIDEVIWIDLVNNRISEFVDNEQLVVKKFLDYSKKNPFEL